MDKVIKEYPALIRKSLKERVRKIFLFGSKARGDSNNSSDYDFLIIVDKIDSKLLDKISIEGANILDNYEELIGNIIWEEKDADYKYKFPLGLNIKKEGLEV